MWERVGGYHTVDHERRELTDRKHEPVTPSESGDRILDVIEIASNSFLSWIG